MLCSHNGSLVGCAYCEMAAVWGARHVVQCSQHLRLSLHKLNSPTAGVLRVCKTFGQAGSLIAVHPTQSQTSATQIHARVRCEVVTRRAQQQLARAEARRHVVCGLLAAMTRVDDVVRLIRGAPDTAAARAALMADIQLTAVQVGKYSFQCHVACAFLCCCGCCCDSDLVHMPRCA